MAIFVDGIGAAFEVMLMRGSTIGAGVLRLPRDRRQFPLHEGPARSIATRDAIAVRLCAGRESPEIDLATRPGAARMTAPKFPPATTPPFPQLEGPRCLAATWTRECGGSPRGADLFESRVPGVASLS